MYAVAFDLVVADTEQHHPKGVTQAYTEIGAILGEHGFRSRCETYARSASSSGRTSRLSSRRNDG